MSSGAGVVKRIPAFNSIEDQHEIQNWRNTVNEDINAFNSIEDQLSYTNILYTRRHSKLSTLLKINTSSASSQPSQSMITFNSIEDQLATTPPTVIGVGIAFNSIEDQLGGRVRSVCRLNRGAFNSIEDQLWVHRRHRSTQVRHLSTLLKINMDNLQYQERHKAGTIITFNSIEDQLFYLR